MNYDSRCAILAVFSNSAIPDAIGAALRGVQDVIKCRTADATLRHPALGAGIAFRPFCSSAADVDLGAGERGLRVAVKGARGSGPRSPESSPTRLIPSLDPGGAALPRPRPHKFTRLASCPPMAIPCGRSPSGFQVVRASRPPNTAGGFPSEAVKLQPQRRRIGMHGVACTGRVREVESELDARASPCIVAEAAHPRGRAFVQDERAARGQMHTVRAQVFGALSE